MSLTKPHPMFTTCDSNVYEVNKTKAMSSLISGRFKSDYMSRHWDINNKDGMCKLCPSTRSSGDLTHLLVFCPALQETRDKLVRFSFSKTVDNPHLSQLLKSQLGGSSKQLISFLLDPSVIPDVITSCQMKKFKLQDVFKICRTWCYSIVQKRRQILQMQNN